MLKYINQNTYFIPPWDSRYGKLGHIYQKYNLDNILRGEGRTLEYYVAPELVINECWYRGYSILKNTNDNNWINRSSFPKRLMDSCGIDIEAYFNLIVLHNNYHYKTPRCSYCHKILNFSFRFKRGYNSSTPWSNDSLHFCSHACENYYHFSHREDLSYIGSNLTAMVRGRELIRQSPDSYCNLYIIDQGDCIKFGITSDINRRSSFLGSNYHIIVSSNRLECANIEAHLKLHFNGSEYITHGELHQFFKYLKVILLTRPVDNPFK